MLTFTGPEKILTTRQNRSFITFERHLYQEHLEEVAFLYEQRLGIMKKTGPPWPGLESVEDRIKAHMDALDLGGQTAASVISSKSLTVFVKKAEPITKSGCTWAQLFPAWAGSYFQTWRAGFPMRYKLGIFAVSTVILLVFFMLTNEAGAAMNPLRIERLGTAVPGEEDVETHFFNHKNREKEITLIRETNPAPIVLWGRNSWASVLYYSQVSRRSTGEFHQRIDFLKGPDRGFTGHFKAMTDAYPVSVHVKNYDDFKNKNLILNFFTGDVNGDGIDELIVLRGYGNIEVYDREKRIARSPDLPRPDLFEYVFKYRKVMKLPDHDEIFITVHREYHKKVSLTQEQRRYHETTRKSWVFRISPQGITRIQPRFKDNTEPSEIDTAVPLNRPGSGKVDELVLLSWVDGAGLSLSRHSLDGKALDVPRSIYADYNMYCGVYSFPQSDQIIGHNGQDRIMYFISPDKKVNWIKTIRYMDIFGSDAETIGETTIDHLPVLILRIDDRLYALDAKGKFHPSMKPGSPTRDKPVPFMTLKTDSPRHDIIKIIPTGKTMESFLVIQNRLPDKRDLSLEQLEKAGRMFLSDSDWEDCQFYLSLRYSNIIHDLAKSYCKRNKISMPDIHSFEDIKNKLPGFYNEELKDAKDSYRISLSTSLFHPLGGGEYNIDQSNYKNKVEYKKWLNNTFIPPELVFTIQHCTQGILSQKKLNDYYFERMDTNGIHMPTLNAKASGVHGTAVMVLNKKILNMDIETAYYSVSW